MPSPPTAGLRLWRSVRRRCGQHAVATHRSLLSASGPKLNKPTISNGSSYQAAPGTALDVPDFDSGGLQAGGSSLLAARLRLGLHPGWAPGRSPLWRPSFIISRSKSRTGAPHCRNTRQPRQPQTRQDQSPPGSNQEEPQPQRSISAEISISLRSSSWILSWQAFVMSQHQYRPSTSAHPRCVQGQRGVEEALTLPEKNLNPRCDTRQYEPY
jgi:hypothetical protein